MGKVTPSTQIGAIKRMIEDKLRNHVGTCSSHQESHAKGHTKNDKCRDFVHHRGYAFPAERQHLLYEKSSGAKIVMPNHVTLSDYNIKAQQELFVEGYEQLVMDETHRDLVRQANQLTNRRAGPKKVS